MRNGSGAWVALCMIGTALAAPAAAQAPADRGTEGVSAPRPGEVSASARLRGNPGGAPADRAGSGPSEPDSAATPEVRPQSGTLGQSDPGDGPIRPKSGAASEERKGSIPR
jgi:hypothetical protein